MPKPRPTPPRISALTYDGGKPFLSGTNLITGVQCTITATVNSVTKSVIWKRDGGTVKTDSGAPYDFTWTPTQMGAHNFVVIPCASSGGSGSQGPAITINWNLIEAPPPPVTTALVSWSQIANATGYRVMWGTVTGQYSYVQDVANNLQYRVPDLQSGTTYFFAAKSYNANQTSDYSNEVAWVPA